MNDVERERFAQLMMKALDGELSGSDHSEFERFLARDECAAEWRQFQKVKEATMNLRISEPAPEVWDGYWSRIHNRLERGIAWLFVTLGAVVLAAWGSIEALQHLWADVQLPWFVRAAVIVLAAGALLLFISIIRERCFGARRDKYREVIR